MLQWSWESWRKFWNFSDFVRISVIFIRAEELGWNGPTQKHNFRHFTRIQNNTNNKMNTQLSLQFIFINRFVKFKYDVVEDYLILINGSTFLQTFSVSGFRNMDEWKKCHKSFRKSFSKIIFRRFLPNYYCFSWIFDNYICVNRDGEWVRSHYEAIRETENEKWFFPIKL